MPNKRIYMLEQRQRDHLAGRWTAWNLRSTAYERRCRAKNDRDILTSDGDPNYQVRLVTFRREKQTVA